jgi:hypothetical protein
VPPEELVIDVDDVGMIQRRGGLRLLLETSPALGASGRICTQDLDGYWPIEMRIEGPVDCAIPPSPSFASIL